MCLCTSSTLLITTRCINRLCCLLVLCCVIYCRYYNAASTPYYQCAVKVQSFMDNYLDATVTEAAAAAQQQQGS